MTDRPHVLLSVAVSVDGYIDDATTELLALSSAEDFDRVDQVRSESDAILIGARTVRADNSSLLVKDAKRRAKRITSGRSEHPLKVTVTASGNLGADLKFWHGGGGKVVYTTDHGASVLGNSLGQFAEVLSLGPAIDFGTVLDDLGARGVQRLMVEGGGQIHTALLSADLVDEIQLAVAPLLIGHAAAPRFLLPADYPRGPASRMRLSDIRSVGDVALLTYRPRERTDG